MPDDQHPRGASSVNDELEVGYDLTFEHGWHRAELWGRVIIGGVVLAGLLGMFGRGPLSHHRATTPDGSLTSNFEPVARFDTSTQVTLHVRPPPEQPREVDVRLSFTLVEPLGLQAVTPQPVRQWAEHGDLVLRVAMPQGGGESLVRLVLHPKVVGPQWLTAEVGGGPVLRWLQFILP